MALFDNMVERFEAFCDTAQGIFVNRVEEMLLEELMDLSAGQQWIDLGCGTGTYSAMLASRGCRVVGVDESKSMLQRAMRKQSNAVSTVDYLLGNITQLPFASGTFDGALLQVTLEFVSAPGRVLEEALRVLKLRGRLVLGLIQGSGDWAKSYRVRALENPSSVYKSAHFWTFPELVKLIGRFPSDLRAGLYVGPEEFSTAEEAWTLENCRRRSCFMDRAGFLALRYDRKDFRP